MLGLQNACLALAALSVCLARPDVVSKTTTDCMEEDSDQPTTTSKSSWRRLNVTTAKPIARSKNHPLNQDSVVFPDGGGGISHVTATPVVSTRVKRNCIHNICEDVEGYPSDRVVDVLKRTSKYNDYFKEEGFAIQIADRGQFMDEGDTLCETRRHTKYPQTAVNINKEERDIVNAGDYKQVLVFETCTASTSCKFSEMFPDDYETSCQQRFVIRRLMVLKEDNQTAFDSFEVPSCCVCLYKKKS